MGLLGVSRETKQIVSKDFLVSKKEFHIKEVEKGLLKTTPQISDSNLTTKEVLFFLLFILLSQSLC